MEGTRVGYTLDGMHFWILVLYLLQICNFLLLLLSLDFWTLKNNEHKCLCFDGGVPMWGFPQEILETVFLSLSQLCAPPHPTPHSLNMRGMFLHPEEVSTVVPVCRAAPAARPERARTPCARLYCSRHWMPPPPHDVSQALHSTCLQFMSVPFRHANQDLCSLLAPPP